MLDGISQAKEGLLTKFGGILGNMISGPCRLSGAPVQLAVQESSHKLLRARKFVEELGMFVANDGDHQ
jgi:hypothetical protein